MKQKTKTIKYITDNKDLKGIYNEMISVGFQCKVAFNVIMILAGKRKAYLFDSYRGHRFLIEGMLKHLEKMKLFKFYYVQHRWSKNEFGYKSITKKEYLENIDIDPSRDLIIYLKDDKTTHNILKSDSANDEFGRLIGLMCAGNLSDLYDSSQRYALGQLRYHIKCHNRIEPFMFQMCPNIMTKKSKEIIEKDFLKYKDLAKELGIKVSYERYPMYRPLVRNMPNFIHQLMFKYRKHKMAKTMKKMKKIKTKKRKSKKRD